MANNNPNTSGLVSLADRTNNERTTIAEQGGIASGFARREKKQMRQMLMAALLLPTEDGKNKKEALAIALINRALTGDTRAFETIMKFIGEMPTEREQTETDEDIENFQLRFTRRQQ